MENASGKEVWKEIWESRRCMIPFSWFYAWKQDPEGKAEMLVQPEGVEMAYMAALYRMEEKEGQNLRRTGASDQPRRPGPYGGFPQEQKNAVASASG